MKEMSLRVDFGDHKYDILMSDITRMFHICYYNSRTWENTFWHGHQILKCPLDMWIYQEILWKIKPDFIIETGTFRGGSALYYAHLFDLQDKGEVITIDINEGQNQPQHPRIHYLSGSSIDPMIYNQVKAMVGEDKVVIVILDSDHSRDHVFQEMNMWHTMVTPNSYMIVEDSNVNGFPVRPDFGPGPMEAIDDFLRINNSFTIDLSMEKFFYDTKP